MSTPIAIIDARSPKEAIDALSHWFEVIPFHTNGITYEAISGHPDIFFTQSKECIIAPNTPKKYLLQLNCKNIAHKIGNTNIDSSLQGSTPYNCLITKKFIIHKQGFTDKTILQSNTEKEFISVPQAYTRCNTIEIAENAFITSDKATADTLKDKGLAILFVEPYDIILPPYPYGFIGGCMGIWEDTIYINGNLSTHKQGEEIRSFIQQHNCSVVELHKGKLYDGGGILIND